MNIITQSQSEGRTRSCFYETDACTVFHGVFFLCFFFSCYWREGFSSQGVKRTSKQGIDSLQDETDDRIEERSSSYRNPYVVFFEQQLLCNFCLPSSLSISLGVKIVLQITKVIPRETGGFESRDALSPFSQILFSRHVSVFRETNPVLMR